MVLYSFSYDMSAQYGPIEYESLVWEENYQSQGIVQIVCYDTPENVLAIKEGYFLYLKGKKTSMIIRKVVREEKTKTIIANGYTAINLLKQKITYPTVYINNVEQGMYKIVNDNKRGLPVVNAPVKNYPSVFVTQFTGNELPEALTKLAQVSGFGYRLNFDYRNKTHVFEVYNGKDLSYPNLNSIVFSSQRKNLVNVKMIEDLDIFKNVAYVAGAGEAENRIVEIVGTATGINAFELWVDARDLQPEDGQTDQEYRKLLRARGIEYLTKHTKDLILVAEVDSSRFGADYDLGDIVTVRYEKYSITFSARIQTVTEIYENNIKTIKIAFSDILLNARR